MCRGQARRLTPHVSQMEDPFFSLDDLFQWLIILTQTQDYFFNDIPVDNVQKLLGWAFSPPGNLLISAYSMNAMMTD